MSLLSDRSGGSTPSAPGTSVSVTTVAPRPAAMIAGALAAAQAVAASLVAVLVPTVLAWVTSGGTEATWTSAVRMALAAWALAHHAGLAVRGGHVGILPLGLTLVPLVACWLAGRRLARVLDPRGEQIEAGLSRSRPVPPPPRALVAFLATYALLAVLLGLLAVSEDVRPISAQVLAGSLAVATIGGFVGVADWTRGGLRRGLTGWSEVLRLPPWLAAGARPALAALAVQGAAGAVLVAAAIVNSRRDVVLVSRALDAGVLGNLLLLLLELALLPNFVLWAAAFAVGPGFAVGTGTSVTVAGSSFDALPALPVLAALPDPGPAPGWLAGIVAVPFLAGGVAGALVVRAGVPARSGLGRCGATAILAGLGMVALAWLSGGPAGPGRLGSVGPDPLVTGAVFAAEVLCGSLVVVAVARSWRRLRGGPEPAAARADREPAAR